MDEVKYQALVVERIFNAPIEKVWNAITDKKQIREWFFDISEFKLEPGFEFQFIGGKGNVNYLILCKVIEVINGRKLSYSWRYEGFRGDSQVTFELFPEADGTRLKLTHQGLETFPMSKRGFLNGYFIPDWEEFILGKMKNILESN
jgi:uncharacterized protein YndB with AHSA1/START domain